MELNCKRDVSAESGINIAKGDTIDETQNMGSDSRCVAQSGQKGAAAQKANEFIRAVISDNTD